MFCSPLVFPCSSQTQSKTNVTVENVTTVTEEVSVESFTLIISICCAGVGSTSELSNWSY
jgi:septum formation inhibitor-activating ATPase MinD